MRFFFIISITSFRFTQKKLSLVPQDAFVLLFSKLQVWKSMCEQTIPVSASEENEVNWGTNLDQMELFSPFAWDFLWRIHLYGILWLIGNYCVWSVLFHSSHGKWLGKKTSGWICFLSILSNTIFYPSLLLPLFQICSMIAWIMWILRLFKYGNYDSLRHFNFKCDHAILSAFVLLQMRSNNSTSCTKHSSFFSKLY